MTPNGSHKLSQVVRTFSTRIRTKQETNPDETKQQLIQNELERAINNASHTKKADRLIVVGSGERHRCLHPVAAVEDL